MAPATGTPSTSFPIGNARAIAKRGSVVLLILLVLAWLIIGSSPTAWFVTLWLGYGIAALVRFSTASSGMVSVSGRALGRAFVDGLPEILLSAALCFIAFTEFQFDGYAFAGVVISICVTLLNGVRPQP